MRLNWTFGDILGQFGGLCDKFGALSIKTVLLVISI